MKEERHMEISPSPSHAFSLGAVLDRSLRGNRPPARHARLGRHGHGRSRREHRVGAPLSPYLMVHDGDAALDFYRRAFAADVIEVYPYEGKLGHATLTINSGEVMLSTSFPRR